MKRSCNRRCNNLLKQFKIELNNCTLETGQCVSKKAKTNSLDLDNSFEAATESTNLSISPSISSSISSSFSSTINSSINLKDISTHQTNELVNLSNQSNYDIQLVKQSLKELFDDVLEIKTNVKALSYKQKITDINFKILKDNRSIENNLNNTNCTSSMDNKSISIESNNFYRECTNLNEDCSDLTDECVNIQKTCDQILSPLSIEFTDELTYRLKGRFKPLRNQNESIKRCANKFRTRASSNDKKVVHSLNYLKNTKSIISSDPEYLSKPFSIKLIKITNCVICDKALNGSYHSCDRPLRSCRSRAAKFQ